MQGFEYIYRLSQIVLNTIKRLKLLNSDTDIYSWSPFLITLVFFIFKIAPDIHYLKKYVSLCQHTGTEHSSWDIWIQKVDVGGSGMPLHIFRKKLAPKLAKERRKKIIILQS